MAGHQQASTMVRWINGSVDRWMDRGAILEGANIWRWSGAGLAIVGAR
jgi:hypothetical protein